jgi:ATP phosphoribosyltransferase
MENVKKERLKIAIQAKGRLNEDSLKILTEAGIKIDSGRMILIAQSSNFPIEILFLRDDDIPQTVADGVAHIGIVGKNEVLEKEQYKVDIIKNLGFSKCRLSLAIPKNAENNYSGIEFFNGKKIATSYPVILQKYLTENNINAEIHVIAGSVEIAPGIGLSDVIFDIVSSGSTLLKNRLKEVETILESEAVLIANQNLSSEIKEILNNFIFRIDSVLNSKGKKYIMLNAKNDTLQEIERLLPGLKSPTVMPLAEKGWSSVHSVIAEDVFWEIIYKLKKAGAEGILVFPIEKMIF